MTNQEKVRRVAEEVGGKVREKYSGRFMYGKTCMGIVCGYPIEAIEVAGELGLRGARQDSMGLSYIVYWPTVSIEGEEK